MFWLLTSMFKTMETKWCISHCLFFFLLLLLLIKWHMKIISKLWYFVILFHIKLQQWPITIVWRPIQNHSTFYGYQFLFAISSKALHVFFIHHFVFSSYNYRCYSIDYYYLAFNFHYAEKRSEIQFFFSCQTKMYKCNFLKIDNIII